MCLLDAVVDWDQTRIHAITDSHSRRDNPLRSGDRLRALNGCEYGAQAMAVHGGLLARNAGRSAAPGFLVALRNVELCVARLDDLDGSLDVHAEQLLGGADGWQYTFRIAHRGTLLVSGRATVMMQR